jgi:CHASE2 domain-containing sensor protein
VRGHGNLIFSLVVIPLIVFLASSLNLLNIGGISNAIEQRYIAFVTHTTQKALSGDIRLIYMDEDHNKDLLAHNRDLAGFMTDDNRRQLWRRLHAQLISKLAGAGAAVVAFDFTFPAANDASISANSAFAHAVDHIRGRSRTRVIIGAEPDESTDKDLGQVFSFADRGNIDIGAGDHQMLRRIEIAVSEGRSKSGQIEERLVVPVPMPLLLLSCVKQTGNRLITFGLDAERSEVTLYENGQPAQHIPAELEYCKMGSQNCPLSEGFEWRRMALLPLVMPSIGSQNEAPYEDVLDATELADYKDKIVIIGARLKEEEVSVPGSDSGVQFYGYQVHAAVLNDLLHDDYPRSLGSIAQLLVFCLLAAFALLGRRLLPRADVKMNTYIFGERLVPVGLLIPILIYGVGGVVLYSLRHVILKVAYDLIVLTAAYFASGSRKRAAVAQQTN